MPETLPVCSFPDMAQGGTLTSMLFGQLTVSYLLRRLGW